jgi:Protein of unknown function (DUF2442)
MSKRLHKDVTTNAEIAAGLRRARQSRAKDRRATRATYDKTSDLVTLFLEDGVRVSIPRGQLQGLHNATSADLSKIKLTGHGTGLRWPTLDVDHYVPGLLNHVFGTSRWMAQLGRIGGSVRSRAKAAAARANGRNGGRPKHQPARTADTHQPQTKPKSKIA